MNTFIAASSASTDACHAKKLEAKRTLDGLTHQVTALSEQMAAQNKLVETHTLGLDRAIGDKRTADQELTVALQACSGASDVAALTAYRSELDELEQMANPQVRNAIASADSYDSKLQYWLDNTQVKADQAAATTVAGLGDDQLVASAQAMVNDSKSSLIQWSVDKCKRLAAMRRKLDARFNPAALGLEYVELNCNETRAKLQEEYEDAYSAISLLYQNSAQTVSDDLATCEAKARAEHESKITAVNQEIEAGTKAILAAKDLLRELQPLLDDVSSTTNKVAAHVTWLDQNCHVATGLTEHLRKVRDLIDTLEACPGRNDFRLQIPLPTS